MLPTITRGRLSLLKPSVFRVELSPADPVPAVVVAVGAVLIEDDTPCEAPNILESTVAVDISASVFEPVDEVSDAPGVGGKTPTFGAEVT